MGMKDTENRRTLPEAEADGIIEGRNAVIEALRLLKEPCVVELYSDSRYVIDALEKRWVYGWKQHGWVKSDKKPALNVDLWEQLLSLIARHEMHYHWVKGHAENEYNNRCDELAVSEWQKLKG